jgi:methyl-accepting chemotaxis protein
MGFLGIAFDMAAVDAGMSAGISNAAKSLQQINDRLDEQTEAIRKIKKEDFFDDMGKGADDASKKIGKLRSVFDKIKGSVLNFNVADIASNIRSLTGETGNLTNSLEATMVSMIQTTKPIAASLNLSGKEMKKFAGQAASMAYGMNTSADAVAETMKSIYVANKSAKEAMDELGLSTKDWVKVVQTTNVPMEEYSAILGDMTTSWKASPKEAARMLDNLMAIGKVAGTGVGAVRNAKTQLDELGDIFKTLPPSMARTSDEIMSLMESSAKMSGVFKAMGSTQEEAITKANAVAKMFADQDVAIKKALAIGDERALIENPLLKYLMRLGIGFDDARKVISTGSRDVVAGMKMVNNVYARFGGDISPQVQRALSGLGGALGDGAVGLSYLASNTEQGTAALEKMSKVAVDGSGALRKFGKDAYSSGLTLQETYDRAKEAFDTTIRSIARQNVRGLVKKQISGMREAGLEIKALGSDKTWGPWINALSQFKQMGIGGLFASLAEYTGVGAKNAAKFGSKFGLIFDTVKQFGSELAPIMHMLGMAGPLAPLLAAGGIGALLFMDNTSVRKILGPFYNVFNDLKNKVVELWNRFSSTFVGVWTFQIKPKIVGFWKEDMKPAMVKFWKEDFVPFLKDSAPMVGSAIWDGIKWAWNKLGEITGVSGQAGVVGGAMLATLGPGMIGAGTSAGIAFLKAVAEHPTVAGGTGLVALAAYAGWKMAESIMGPKSVAGAVAEAGVIAGGDEDKFGMYKLAWQKKPEEMAGQLARLRSALKAEKESWFPDKDDVKILEKAISLLSDAQNELILDKTESNVERYTSGGKTTAEQFLYGLTSGLEEGRQSVDDSLDFITDGMIAHSPIKSGPLAGEGESNAAYRGGYFTMEQFALGITDSTDVIKRAIEETLNDSVILTIDTYAQKMKELAEQKMFLTSIAKAMVKDLGGKIETTVDADSDINVKKNFEAAMTLPGLASIVLAVSNEGSMTRKLLKRMLDESIKQTVIMSGGGTSVAVGERTPPPV